MRERLYNSLFHNGINAWLKENLQLTAGKVGDQETQKQLFNITKALFQHYFSGETVERPYNVNETLSFLFSMLNDQNQASLQEMFFAKINSIGFFSWSETTEKIYHAISVFPEFVSAVNISSITNTLEKDVVSSNSCLNVRYAACQALGAIAQKIPGDQLSSVV